MYLRIKKISCFINSRHMSLVFLLFLFSKAYLKNVASIAKKSIILSIISMYKRSSSDITGTE